jgi:hypothetical protein
MAKLLIQTQVYENYAYDENGVLGTGDNAYWKPKGGGDYVIKNFRDFGRVTETVMAVRSQIEQDNDAFREHIINFEVVADDYLTEFERSQLEYEGSIRYPANEIVW